MHSVMHGRSVTAQQQPECESYVALVLSSPQRVRSTSSHLADLFRAATAPAAQHLSTCLCKATLEYLRQGMKMPAEQSCLCSFMFAFKQVLTPMTSRCHCWADECRFLRNHPQCREVQAKHKTVAHHSAAGSSSSARFSVFDISPSSTKSLSSSRANASF